VTALGDDAPDQYERTQLAWRRTALSLVATGLLVAHLAARDIGSGALVTTLSATTAVVAFVWLSSHGRAVGAAGLALVLGVLLLGAVTLVGVATG
jgi:uncharacterized membrane protein YidH (DUF202 family)